MLQDFSTNLSVALLCDMGGNMVKKKWCNDFGRLYSFELSVVYIFSIFKYCGMLKAISNN